MQARYFKSDNAIIAYIDSLNQESLDEYENWRPVDLRHYVKQQKTWLEKAIYLLGTRLGHEPSMEEIAEEVLKTPHSKRFRAFYCIKFPRHTTAYYRNEAGRIIPSVNSRRKLRCSFSNVT